MALFDVLKSVIGSKKPTTEISNDYIDSLMVYHSKFRDKLQGVEYDFVRELLLSLKAAGITLPLFYELRGGLVRFKLCGYQLGGIESLGWNNQKGKVQIITDKKVYWYDVQNLEDALRYIPDMVRQAKSLQNFHFKL